MSNAERRFIPKYASLIIVLVTVIPPYSSFLYGMIVHSGQTSLVVATYAISWVIYPHPPPLPPPFSSFGGLQILTLNSLIEGPLLGIFNIIFAFQVIRYIRGKASKKRTLVAGALTLVLPIMSLIVALPLMFSSGVFVYVGPIPIQLISGLLLMHLAGPKEITSPW
ncbi:MAG: hypothetical protein ACFFEV_01265 [Candidatus Thorarchaeota archaeon]